MGVIMRSRTYVMKDKSLARHISVAIINWERDNPGSAVRSVKWRLDYERSDGEICAEVDAEIEIDETIVPTTNDAPAALAARKITIKDETHGEKNGELQAPGSTEQEAP